MESDLEFSRAGDSLAHPVPVVRQLHWTVVPLEHAKDHMNVLQFNILADPGFCNAAAPVRAAPAQTSPVRPPTVAYDPGEAPALESLVTPAGGESRQP